MSSRPYQIIDQYAVHDMTFRLVGIFGLMRYHRYLSLIIDSLAFCQKHKGLIIHAYLLMDDHVYMIARAERSSEGLSAIIRDFKKYTAIRTIQFLSRRKTVNHRFQFLRVCNRFGMICPNNRFFQVWIPNNKLEVLFSIEKSYRRINTIHQMPFEKGKVHTCEAYPYSSAKDYVTNQSGPLKIEILESQVFEDQWPRKSFLSTLEEI